MTKRRVEYIDVGNMSPNEVDDYMEEMLCRYNNKPYVKKSKVRRWMYDLCDTLGIAGGFGI